ncbi:MAG TPA: DUF1543 domain-containing protein [Sphingobacteriaceae bacterium]|nr:DUF1543 domain-containing protein [Sphingobacteriaceae bacterium]
MDELKLFMVLLGCKPGGRHTEQHDIFFGVAMSIKELVPEILNFWPEAKGKIHLDGWREVTCVDGYNISVIIKEPNQESDKGNEKLFFINLGGYKINEFDEFHYKILNVNDNKEQAIAQSKQTAFYKHVRFPGAESHIDDKYGIDVDDIHLIEEILPAGQKNIYRIEISKTEIFTVDDLHLGYFKLDKL